MGLLVCFGAREPWSSRMIPKSLISISPAPVVVEALCVKIPNPRAPTEANHIIHGLCFAAGNGCVSGNHHMYAHILSLKRHKFDYTPCASRGCQSAPAGEHHEHHGGLVSPFKDGLGPHPLEPKKGPGMPSPKSPHSMPKPNPNWQQFGGPPPQTIEMKGFLGRAFVIINSIIFCQAPWRLAP